MPLIEFLLHHTKVLELCAITESGYISATVFIDSEDLFTRCLSPLLREKKVKQDHWDTLPIVDASGKRVKIPCRYIEVG